MYWHSYECDDAECKRGPTGMVLEVRTDWAREPKGVRCPFCQRKPYYRGHRMADEDGYRQAPPAKLTTDSLLDVLRSKTPKELEALIQQAKVIECWMPHNNEAVWYVFAVGQPFKALGHVARLPATGGWACVLGDGTATEVIATQPTRMLAQTFVETELRRHGYVVPSPASHEVPPRQAAN